MDQDFFRNILTVVQIVGGAACFVLMRAYYFLNDKNNLNGAAIVALVADLAAYKLHVAETYTTNKAMDSILSKLDRIEDKLDKKQDKP